MLTFQKFIENIQGEYWIDNHGDIHYADGNVSDYNHEGHVISQLQSEIADKYKNGKYNQGEYVDWDNFCEDILTTYQKKNPQIDDDSQLMQIAMDDLGVSEEEYHIANGQGDARLYGMKYWGWKRVQGNNVETWNLTPQDMKIIAQGLDEILDQSGEEMPDSEVDVYVHVYAVKKDFSYTLEQLKNNGVVPIKPGTGFDAKQNHHANAAQNYLAQQKPSNPFYKGFAEWLKTQ